MREINLKFKQPHNTHVHLTHVNQQTFSPFWNERRFTFHYLLWILLTFHPLYSCWYITSLEHTEMNRLKDIAWVLTSTWNYTTWIYLFKIYKIHVQKMINLKSLIDFDVHLHLSMSEKEGHSVQHLNLCYVFTCRIV